MNSLTIAILLISLSSTYAIDNRKIIGHSSRFLSEASPFLDPCGDGAKGTRWAVLVGGSKGWENYRHQADVCHAYQILKKGGLKDENIIVMMYDDIADNPENPRPGVIINSPNGSDVYRGVPKDYTGEDVNGENFFNVLLGNETAVKGGNGKVVKSGPKDHIFVYYVDHGSPLILGMPTDYITAEDLNKVLKKKHAMGTYKSMVFYLEACEAGSMFDGLLPKNISIYATTASSPYESSYAYYCPGEENPPPKEFGTCLGDVYSISWMEDWEQNSTAAETLKQQFKKVKKRTANYSEVLEYGDHSLRDKNVSVYLGTNPAKDAYVDELLSSQLSSSVHQRDAKLLYLREKFRRAPEGSQRKLEAKKQIIEAMKHREYVDNSIEMITKLLFGSEKGLEVMKSVRPAGQAPVDDWDCFESLLHTYEANCGALSPYGRKHTRIFANFCNAGIRQQQMEKAATQVCDSKI